LNPSVMNFFTDTMDALEIWIGDTRGQIDTNFLGRNAGDWFNMINQGLVRTGVSDSDTHTAQSGVGGFPRNMVASPSDDPADLSGLADTLSANVNAGRVFGTDGPMVRVSVNAASTGQTASLELGSPLTISTSDGAVDITVDIQSPTWAEFDKVEYYINTTTTRHTLTNQQTGAGPISVNRYTLTPDAVQTAGVDFTVNTVPVAGTSSSRLEATTTLSLTGLTNDIYVVVMVKGTDGVSKPLFPVLPNSLDTSTNATLSDLIDGNLGELQQGSARQDPVGARSLGHPRADAGRPHERIERRRQSLGSADVVQRDGQQQQPAVEHRWRRDQRHRVGQLVSHLLRLRLVR
jgi:hypothetical protein